MVSKKRLKRYVKLMSACNSGNFKVDQDDADATLCMLLDEIGYGEVVATYIQVGNFGVK